MPIYYTRILDFPRHLGQHSGGMVISLNRLDGIVPLEPASMDKRNIIQWDKDDCEKLKIVKVDLLGLGMMAVLRDTITLISEHHGKTLDLYQIPKDDPKVYEALQNADTVGMFQVESRAQIAFLPKSKPKEFYDIVVQVAIIRPGPIVGNMLKSYINRRQGKEKIDYLHDSLKPILERTLGVPLFQEQLLKIDDRLPALPALQIRMDHVAHYRTRPDNGHLDHDVVKLCGRRRGRQDICARLSI